MNMLAAGLLLASSTSMLLSIIMCVVHAATSLLGFGIYGIITYHYAGRLLAYVSSAGSMIPNVVVLLAIPGTALFNAPFMSSF